MSFTISTFEHKVASIALETVREAKHLLDVVVPALKFVNASEVSIEAVTSLVDPGVVPVERSAFTALGLIIKALEDVHGVADNPTTVLSITVDSGLMKDYRDVAAIIKLMAAKKGVSLAS
jgi:hypothetical protein